jgi:hypothetical protein
MVQLEGLLFWLPEGSRRSCSLQKQESGKSIEEQMIILRYSVAMSLGLTSLLTSHYSGIPSYFYSYSFLVKRMLLKLSF